MFETLKTSKTARVLLATGTVALAGCGDHPRHEHVEIEQFGANTFMDYQHASGMGPYLDKGQKVEVDCLETGPVAAAPSAEGKWYRIVDPKEYKGLFVAANSFENGDTQGPLSSQPAVDPKVPNC